MKTQLLLALFFCFAFQLDAQHFQIVDQTDFDNRVTVTAPIPSGGFYAAVQAAEPGLIFSKVLLMRYDAAGNEIWRFELPGAEHDLAYDLLVWPYDTSVFVCGTNRGCALGSWGFVARIGADGALRWHVYEDFMDPVSPVEMHDLTALSTDEICMLFTLDSYGIHLFEPETGAYVETYEFHNLGLGTIHDMHFHQWEGQFYLAGSQGINRYHIFSETIEPVLVAPTGEGPFLEIIALNDTLMMTYSEDGEVIVFDENGVVDTFDWSSHGAQQVSLNDDGRFVVYSYGKVYVYGPDFQLQQQFEPWLAGLTVNDVNWSEDRIVLAGDEAHTTHWEFRNTAAWAQNYDTNGQTYNSVMEVEMMEVIKTQQPIATFINDGWNVYYSVTQGAFDVRIRNLSFATLDTLTIHTAYYGRDEVYIDCIPLSSHKSVTFTGLNLGPAEEVTLPIGLVESPHVPFNRINPWKVCFWAGNPNGQTDNDHTNNLACVDVYPTVSADEPEFGAFALFPNPATDACTITWSENLQPETIQLYDAFGRLLFQDALNTSVGMYNLQLGNLPSGMYTVALGNVVQRLIKQ